MIKKIIKTLRQNKRFIISSHQNLEGDAIGSQLALALLLKHMGKKVILLSPERVPKTYSFLPDLNTIRNNIRVKRIDYDVACIVDCTDLDRLGNVKKALDLKKPIINIDHHVSNSRFGTINWVAPELSCTGEQIYHLFKETDTPINKRAALYIYVAILTDTGSFRYSNTSANTHRIASELIKKGLNQTHIYRKIYEEAHRSRLELLSAALSTLDISKDGKIAWLKVTQYMLKKYKMGIEGTEDFVNFPRSIKGVKIALAFREVGKNIIKISFRSNTERINVSTLAKQFGGGGHPAASACTFKGNMGEVEEAVLLKARQWARGRL